MADKAVANAHTSAARTVSNNGTSTRVPLDSLSLAVTLNVTAVSGTTPSLTLSVEWSQDGATFAQADPPDVFTAVSAAGARVKKFDVKGEFFRIVYAITGTTPSFTFTATAYGV
jgi:hypothetical protein